ncbi:MAG: TrbI/VirB10 family protein [Candidatus Eremiobacteraeota bacterium]|nr:TrbI/VirB10 family protein [Acetobacteraceae bacterium]MBV8435330.1 TrbI/VirB10 family protein [Candidatus Eremiobacteraeota bacterium]
MISTNFRNLLLFVAFAVLGVVAYYIMKPDVSRLKAQIVPASTGSSGDDPSHWLPEGTPIPAASPVVMPQAQPVTPPPPKLPQQESEAERRLKAAYLSDIAVEGPNDNETDIAPRLPAVPLLGAAAPPHSIFPGTFIHAVLRTEVNSDIPGPVEAQVEQDVRDTNTGSEILIPKYSRLIGQYDNNLLLTQQRLLVLWTKLVLPNGAEREIPRWPGADAAGANGFTGHVDNHAVRIWGPSILTSAIIAATAYATMPSYNNYGPNAYQNMAQQQALATGAYSLSARAQEQLNRKLEGVKPTITIPQGYPFTIMVRDRWSFDAPYEASR